jgi:hypothetical protein
LNHLWPTSKSIPLIIRNTVGQSNAEQRVFF